MCCRASIYTVSTGTYVYYYVSVALLWRGRADILTIDKVLSQNSTVNECIPTQLVDTGALGAVMFFSRKRQFQLIVFVHF